MHGSERTKTDFPTLPFLTTRPRHYGGVLWSYGAVRYPPRSDIRWEVRVANGYCVKCKTSREIKDAKQITMKNGRPATQGLCPVCGTKIFKIGGSAAPAAPTTPTTPTTPAS